MADRYFPGDRSASIARGEPVLATVTDHKYPLHLRALLNPKAFIAIMLARAPGPLICTAHITIPGRLIATHQAVEKVFRKATVARLVW